MPSMKQPSLCVVDVDPVSKYKIIILRELIFLIHVI